MVWPSTTPMVFISSICYGLVINTNTFSHSLIPKAKHSQILYFTSNLECSLKNSWMQKIFLTVDCGITTQSSNIPGIFCVLLPHCKFSKLTILSYYFSKNVVTNILMRSLHFSRFLFNCQVVSPINIKTFVTPVHIQSLIAGFKMMLYWRHTQFHEGFQIFKFRHASPLYRQALLCNSFM